MSLSFFYQALLSLVFVLPIYMCNAFASFVGAIFKKRDRIIPMDGENNWRDGKRILGDHKTWPGFIGGLIFGIITGIILWYLNLKYVFFVCSYPWYIGLFMSLGDHSADLLGSFVKRRIDISPGGSLPLYDQGSWMLTGLLFALPFTSPFYWVYFVIPLVVTPILHILTGFISMWTGVKEVWY